MPRDYVEELALIEMSKLQRKTWEFDTLLRGVSPDDMELVEVNPDEPEEEY